MAGMDKRSTAVVYAVAVSVIWGLSFLSTKVAIAVLPPMTIAAARFAVAVLLLLPLAMREDLRLDLRDLPLMAASGLMGVTIYFLCENNGIALLTASESSLVIATIPVLTMLVERVAFGARLRARSYAGAVLSFAGVGLIVLPSLGARASSLPGFLYMGGAAVAWVIYALLTKPLGRRYGRVGITFWQSFFGLLGCIPFALAESSSWKGVGLTVTLNILYLGVLCSAVGYWLYVSAMDRLGAGTTSVFLNLVPVVSVGAAFALLGERLGAASLAGGAVAIGGVYLATASGPTRSGPTRSDPTLSGRASAGGGAGKASVEGAAGRGASKGGVPELPR
jgi:drug/metabolite transporter (DMT)-like permease